MLEIVMLHNVKKEIAKKVGPIADYAVTEKEFEDFIVSRDSWYKLSPEKLNNASRDTKNLLITFDDGYRDNLTTALPLLEKHNIPCVIFCTTGFISGSSYPYEVELAEIIEQNDRLQIEDSEVEETGSPSRKIELYQNLRLPLRERSYSERETFLQKLASLNSFDREEYQNESFLSWEEVTELSKHPLVTIGAHTVNHEQLAILNPKDAYQEILQSKSQIENHVDKEVIHFSYPYGANSLLTRILTRIADFKFGFSTDRKKISRINFWNRMKLPRTDITTFI